MVHLNAIVTIYEKKSMFVTKGKCDKWLQSTENVLNNRKYAVVFVIIRYDISCTISNATSLYELFEW